MYEGSLFFLRFMNSVHSHTFHRSVDRQATLESVFEQILASCTTWDYSTPIPMADRIATDATGACSDVRYAWDWSLTVSRGFAWMSPVLGSLSEKDLYI